MSGGCIMKFREECNGEKVTRKAYMESDDNG